MTIVGAPVHTDDLGMRVRPEARGSAPTADRPAGDDPLRVVVLGDSVAFGFGLRDDETLACRLEELLAAALPERAVECRTVAVPGWNHRNAVSFLLDHLDRYPADLVLYMPIGNDLVDGYSVRESGFRREIADVAAADPWLGVSADRSERFLVEVARRLRRSGAELLRDDAGSACLNADLTPESSRRYDENARSIVLLHDVLARRGTRLALLQFAEEPYTWILWTRLVDAGLELPVLPLFVAIPVDLQQPTDPHPSAEGQRVMAAWTLRSLASLGLVAGLSPDALVDDPTLASHDAVRAPPRDAAAWRALADEARAAAARGVRPDFDLRTGRGAFQVLGGVNPDGSFDAHGLLVLRRAGDVLSVELDALEGRPDLDGLEVLVEVARRPVGRVTLSGDGPTTARFDVPPGLPRDAPVEVAFVAGRAVVTEFAGRAQMASFRLLHASFED
ncbi:MAG: SGNH/GDSL hydrolase family protein [Planctomycetes bacterium]|nr:SGNH/GDSL hydrolase family protein [Planctomycetota bacterium]